MSTEKVRGVVIREVPVGESDKIITLLTKEMGKITLSARGARKPGSKYLASCEAFAYSDFVVYTARKNPSVASAVLIDSFYGLRTSLDRFCCAAYLSEVCGRLIFEGADCSDYMLLLLTAFKSMAEGRGEPYVVSLAFELKFLSLGGMLPEFSLCRSCGRAIDGGAYFTAEGLVCEDCGREGFKISSGTIKALRYIKDCDIRKTFSFNISSSVKSELSSLRERLFLEQTEFEFKTHSMFKKVCGK